MAHLLSLSAGCLLAAALLIPAAPAGAQGAPGAAPNQITFRCPGVTEISATAESPALNGRQSPEALLPVSPVDAAESPCIIDGSGPEIVWSADYTALRMAQPGTWRTKLRIVLTDFDALHREYVRNPQVKDMGMWPAKLEETFQLADRLAYQSRSDVVIYYAAALRGEYKAGIFDDHPLLTQYALQARAKLDELTAPRR